jgi:alpha-tubulin suppressor-like RCC1 family protein
MNRTIFDATKQNNFPLVLKYLKEFENNPNERDENGLTCLHICATYGHVETAKVLVSCGADLEMKDVISGWTALHRSIYFQHIQLTLFLIHVGARLDIQSFTSEYSHSNKLDSSSSSSSDSLLRDHEGFTPLDLLSFQLKKNLKLFSSHSSSPSHAFTSHGVIMSFGKADFTLGVPLPKSSDISRPKRIDALILESIVDVSAAKYHALAVTKEGKVFSWGNGRSGKLGNGSENSHPEPVMIHSILKYKIIKIATSESHSLVLSEDGTVFSFGSDRFGQLGHGNNDSNRWISQPKRIELLKKETVIGIAAGDHHSLCYTDDGKVFAWGSNKNGQLGISPSELSTGSAGVNCSPIPKKISLPFTTASTRTKYSSTTTGTVIQIVAAYQSSLLLCRTFSSSSTSNTAGGERWRESFNTEVYQWGDGISMIRRVYFNNRLFNKRSRSHEYTANQPFFETHLTFRNDNVDLTNIISIAAGKNHFVGLSSLGFVYTWGLGSDQLGHSQPTMPSESWADCSSTSGKGYVSIPQIVEGLLPENGGGKVVSISVSGNRTCAITELGDLFTWGATNDKVKTLILSC